VTGIGTEHRHRKRCTSAGRGALRGGGRLDEAEQLLVRAREIGDQAFTPGSPFVFDLNSLDGSLLVGLGRYDEAVRSPGRGEFSDQFAHG